MSIVCNCKVEFIRKKGYDNLAQWCQDSNNVYIGRKGIVFITKLVIKKDFQKKIVILEIHSK